MKLLGLWNTPHPLTLSYLRIFVYHRPHHREGMEPPIFFTILSLESRMALSRDLITR